MKVRIIDSDFCSDRAMGTDIGSIVNATKSSVGWWYVTNKELWEHGVELGVDDEPDYEWCYKFDQIEVVQ